MKGKLIIILLLVVGCLFRFTQSDESSSTPLDSSDATAHNPIDFSIFNSSEKKPTFEFDGYIGVYDTATEQQIRRCGNVVELQDLGNGEYYSFCLELIYNGKEPLAVNNLYMCVDGGTPWAWSTAEITEGYHTVLHAYHVNMKALHTEGSHIAEWYLNDELIFSEEFHFMSAMDWQSQYSFPSNEQIRQHNAAANYRSPYIAGWLNIPPDQRYTEYRVDFKADYVPEGTYCCLGNWKMDYSSLTKNYASYRTEYPSVQGYAGFQRLSDGKMMSIMSFWDVFCTDFSGKESVIRAKQVYPTQSQSGSFGGEGTGAHYIGPYEWEAGTWYRMHLKCTTYRGSENTVVEQWVCNLNTGEWTLLCAYDVGVTNACFYGSTAVFLENFVVNHSGDIRSMEVRNASYCSASDGIWYSIPSATLSSNGGIPQYEGSYRFGCLNGRLWMITSGVGGDWHNNGKGQKTTSYKLN